MSALAEKTNERFSLRRCPACEQDNGTRLFDLRVDQFCSANHTYNPNVFDLLNLDETDSFPIDRCLACGFVYARLLPDPDFLKTVYEDVIDFKSCQEYSENGFSYARRSRYVADLIELNSTTSPLKALDYGMGLGVTLRLLKSMAVDAVGYDPSPARADSVKRNDVAVVDDLEEVRRNGPFDLLICDNVLEHVPEPKKTLRFLSSVSKPGAALFMSVPRYEKDFIEQQLQAIQNGQTIDMTLNPWEHLNYFTLHHLDQMLNSVGFVALKASELPGNVNIGLRPDSNSVKRMKNGLASVKWLLRYVTTGDSRRNVESAYYRFVG